MAKTVLVVDDNREFLNLLDLMLGKAGYHVVLAESAVEALDLLETTVPDAVVLDIMMPVRSGFELLENIRWDPRFTKIPVIVVTAMTLNEEEREFIDEFAVTYLDKTRAPELNAYLQQILSNG